jgi:hypothetical protein
VVRPQARAVSFVAVPILEVTGLRPPADIDLRAALSAVCTEVAALLGEAASGTWAIWRTADEYVEGTVGVDTQPATTHPPRVRVIAFEGKAGEQIAAVITCVADALARELKLEQGNVFVTYEEATSGRLYTGGQVVGR